MSVLIYLIIGMVLVAAGYELRRRVASEANYYQVRLDVFRVFAKLAALRGRAPEGLYQEITQAMNLLRKWL